MVALPGERPERLITYFPTGNELVGGAGKRCTGLFSQRLTSRLVDKRESSEPLGSLAQLHCNRRPKCIEPSGTLRTPHLHIPTFVPGPVATRIPHRTWRRRPLLLCRRRRRCRPRTATPPTRPSSSPSRFPAQRPLSGGTEAKTLHLSALRKAVSAVQDKVNKELTLRMEQDKAENTAAQARQAAVDEAAEEENYGEEVQGEDD